MGLCGTFEDFKTGLRSCCHRPRLDLANCVAFIKPTQPVPWFNTYYLPTYRSMDAILAYILRLLSHHILSLNFYKLSQYLL